MFKNHDSVQCVVIFFESTVKYNYNWGITFFCFACVPFLSLYFEKIIILCQIRNSRRAERKPFSFCSPLPPPPPHYSPPPLPPPSYRVLWRWDEERERGKNIEISSGLYIPLPHSLSPLSPSFKYKYYTWSLSIGMFCLKLFRLVVDYFDSAVTAAVWRFEERLISELLLKSLNSKWKVVDSDKFEDRQGSEPLMVALNSKTQKHVESDRFERRSLRRCWQP